MTERCRVILFGAGASHGAVRVIPRAPPLGPQLFDQLRAVYPDAWGKIPDEMRPDFVPNFELGMKKIWDSGSNDGTVLLRAIGHFFAQFRADHSSAYGRLLEHLEYRGVLEGTHFSSVNYECVLETAARNYGFNAILYSSQDGTTDSALSVWKIHGSCNFLPVGIAGGASAVSYSPAAVSWNGGVKIVDPTQVGPFIETSAFYPAMAVFMEGKPVHSSPGVIIQLQQWWKSAVEIAPAIGIIGVNPNPTDQHIWGPLAQAEGRIVVIGDEASYDGWAQDAREGRSVEVVGSKFADSLDDFAEALSGE